MILNAIILAALLGTGVHSTPTRTFQSKEPHIQHTAHAPVFENQVWSYHLPKQNSGQSVKAGFPFYQQQTGGAVNAKKDQTGKVDVNKDHQTKQFQTGTVAIANEQLPPSPAHDNVGKAEQYPRPLMPFYEDQVTILPFMDEVDSDEEQQVWPPVGIYPPPPPPPVSPTFYPPYYPTQYPVTKPPTRPTTIRPPNYPSLFPNPPYYPQYPSEELPHHPHYPLYPRPTTQRPPYITTTPSYPKPGGKDVVVLENYQVISDRGISKYKLRLSNGLTDFKKIFKKQIGNKTIYAQTGYYSVPVDPEKNKFDLMYYIADERGFRVQGVRSCSNEYPCKVLSE